MLEVSSLDRAAWDSSRRQYVAELLNDQIKREHPALVYDALQNLLNVSAAPNENIPPTVLITNRFQNGRLVGQTLSDGSVYSYDYLPAGGGEAHSAVVHTPDGASYEVIFGQRTAAVRQQHTQPMQLVPGGRMKIL